MQEDDVIEQYTNEEEIKKIFEFVTKNKIIKTEHFYQRIFERDINENLVDETLPKFEKIKLIDKRRHPKDFGYDFYYELSNSQTLKLCFIPLKDKTLLINAILRSRKWQGSLRFSSRRN